jgi:hypothetical protein
MATGTPRPGTHHPPELLSALRWRRVFPGHGRELSALRRWLVSLLPDCPARDDVLVVATELAGNAIEHTASGQDGWFAVEVVWHRSAVQVAVADRGGPAEPRVIDDPDGERGRGLRLVHGLSVRTGFAGDQRGRWVWAQIAWTGPEGAAAVLPEDPYQLAIRDGEVALARRFAGVPAWFGRATLQWWALPGSGGLVSAQSAPELAALLFRLDETAGSLPPDATGQPPQATGDEPALPPARERTISLRRPGPGTGPRSAGSDRLDGRTQRERPQRPPGAIPCRAEVLAGGSRAALFPGVQASGAA